MAAAKSDFLKVAAVAAAVAKSKSDFLKGWPWLAMAMAAAKSDFLKGWPWLAMAAPVAKSLSQGAAAATCGRGDGKI